MTETLPILLRTMAETDIPFIVDAWVESYRSSSRAREAGRSYRRGQRALVRRILERAACVVACLEKDNDAIAGFAVTEGDTIHYVFVRDAFTRVGLATSMLLPFASRDTVRYSHRPSVPIRIPETWVYDPYLAH